MNATPGRELARSSRALVRVGGTSTSTQPLAWGGQVHKWDELPNVIRRAAHRAGPVLADQVVADLLTQTPRGLVHVAHAWRLRRSALVIAKVARRVEDRSGVVVGLESWQTCGLREVRIVGEVVRRVGTVGAGVLRTHGPTDGGDPSRGEGIAPTAAVNWGYLPPPVRERAEFLVPVPEYWVAEILRTGALINGNEVTHVVTALRADAQRLVVVRAARSLTAPDGVERAVIERALASRAWHVEQFEAELAEIKTLTATRDEWLP